MKCMTPLPIYKAQKQSVFTLWHRIIMCMTNWHYIPCVCMKSAIIDLIMLVGRISITYWIFVVPHFTMENNNNDDDKKRPFILFYTIMSLFFCSRYFVLHILNMNIFTLQKRRKWVVVLLMVLQILTRYTCNNESISILFGRKLVQNILMII